MEKSIKIRIGALAVLGMFLAIVLGLTVVAQDPDTNVPATGSYSINIDRNNDESDRIFRVTHDGNPGPELFRVQETGEVGIGTTSPGNKLTVQDDYGVAVVFGGGQIRIQGDTDSDKFLALQLDTTSDIAMIQAGDSSLGNYDYYPLLLNPSGGNVGIGVATPQNKLDVEGGAVIGATYSGTNTAPTNGLLVEGNVGIGTASPSTALHVDGDVAFGDGSELTISGGVVTATDSYHTIDTESNAASDELVTIDGGSVAGEILIIRAIHNDRTVVAIDNTGNLRLEGDFDMDYAEDTLTLIFDGSNWLEISRSNNRA